MIKILLVDEHPAVALRVRLRMNTLGYQVEKEHDAVSAISQAMDEYPNALVLDLNPASGRVLAEAQRHQSPIPGQGANHVYVTPLRKPRTRSHTTGMNRRKLVETLFGSDEKLKSSKPSTL